LICIALYDTILERLNELQNSTCYSQKTIRGYHMNSNFLEIPIVQKGVLAISINIEKQKEHVLIGELDEIKLFLNGFSSAQIISEVKRPIGTFIADCCNPIPNIISNIRSAFSREVNTQNKDFFEQAKNQLFELYQSNNLCFQFYALHIWQEYNKRQTKTKKLFMKSNGINSMPNFMDYIEDLTLPSRISMESEIIQAQKFYDVTPLDAFDSILFQGMATYFYTLSNGFSEYVVADFTVMPVLIFYLNTIYNNHQYLQRCKVCNRLFLAHTANIATLCSDECRRVQSRLNKRKYDNVKKDISYEKNYKNNYMYWYNKLEKLKKMRTVNYQPFEEAFQSFCKEARVKKKNVKDGSLSVSSYDDWILSQRNNADEIMSQILRGQSQKKKSNLGQSF